MVENKIFVVIAVVLIIFVGIIVYLSMLDRNVKKLEKRLEEEQPETEEP
ncbi:MAG: CcmD family protein [Bacteroidales bacterium]|nr:CcmD family protein [Bacteroidales bacterium]